VYCNIRKSSGVAIAKRGVEVAEEQIANRGKSNECPALIHTILCVNQSCGSGSVLDPDWIRIRIGSGCNDYVGVYTDTH
jgi:hypothetical protein